MSLNVGIVGLPNVGKSTLFNALTGAQNAEAANYPFCTIEPNKATVPVPDDRLAVLAALAGPEKITHAVVDFIDIAGLVRGASTGEGLGNQFLGNIRDCSAVLEMVRCFDDDNIIHVNGCADPLRDMEIVETELLLADLQSVEKRLEKVKRAAKGDKAAQALHESLEALRGHLNKGLPAASFAAPVGETLRQSLGEQGLLTAKKIIYCANIDEGAVGNPEAVPHVRALLRHAAGTGRESVIVCAKIEEELQGLSKAEQVELLHAYGIKESALAQVIRCGFKSLGLTNFFTAGPKEVRAWTITGGSRAPQAAGVIHGDFERGFIRAEVTAYEDYIRLGSEAAARAAGLLRIEGKEYVVKDGDVMHFLFNV
ncbi:MAG: redox-regulated ATPase YchF [Desulfovibrio sp.]|jgi:GTP-binding protein YchF|nr:redox-regulated ATPase YchF [Desulfovibrio sp.]